MVETAAYHFRVSQFDSHEWSVFNSRFTRFVLRSNGSLKFVIIVKNFVTGSLSLITVGKKYLFAFQF